MSTATPLDSHRQSILGVPVDLLDCETALAEIVRWCRSRERHYVTVTNTHDLMTCLRDREMFEATCSAGLNLPDGIGVILAAAMLGLPHRGRVPGPALMLHVLDHGRAAGLRHYFFGGRRGVPELLWGRMIARYPGAQIAGCCSPPFGPVPPEAEQALIDEINVTEPDVVWVGLGAPKQHKWMARNVGKIAAGALIGVGAAFDFHAGTVPWAPAIVRKAGLEWAFRLCTEPGRLWRRNLDSPRLITRLLVHVAGRALHSALR